METAKRFGRKVSSKIQNELNKPIPELPQHLFFYFQAFKDLARDRTSGFAPSAIPFTSILTYSRTYKCDPETEDNLIFFVTGLDDHYLARSFEENKKEREKAESKKRK